MLNPRFLTNAQTENVSSVNANTRYRLNQITAANNSLS